MQPEYELIGLAKRGDLKAFEQLVVLNSSKVYGAAYRILNHKEQAEDCVQEAFMKAYLKIGSFNEESRFSTWAYSITVNTALDMLRKNAKHTDFSDQDLDQMTFSEESVSEKSVWISNVGEITQKAIAQLSDDVRTAFLLRHYEECSIAEISQILGINPSTAKSRIFRAVGRLRELLQLKVGDYETVD
ncbi:MAG: RNA polymerase sigma-70 factor (ECF subfamily) [Arenicella sp.]|jgi:RNA polymerase sigma-70 factor (ECF subfamily)